MNHLRKLLLMPVLAALSCALDPGPPPATPVMRWAAELEAGPRFGDVRGEVFAVQVEGGTTAQLQLEGGSPGAVHPWHVHAGSCASRGEIAGETTDYPPIELDEDGSGSATALVASGLEADESYHVNVHLATDQIGTVIACGDLRRADPD